MGEPGDGLCVAVSKESLFRETDRCDELEIFRQRAPLIARLHSANRREGFGPFGILQQLDCLAMSGTRLLRGVLGVMLRSHGRRNWSDRRSQGSGAGGGFAPGGQQGKNKDSLHAKLLSK